MELLESELGMVWA